MFFDVLLLGASFCGGIFAGRWYFVDRPWAKSQEGEE